MTGGPQLGGQRLRGGELVASAPLVGAWMRLLPADWRLLGGVGVTDSLPSIKKRRPS